MWPRLCNCRQCLYGDSFASVKQTLAANAHCYQNELREPIETPIGLTAEGSGIQVGHVLVIAWYGQNDASYCLGIGCGTLVIYVHIGECIDANQMNWGTAQSSKLFCGVTSSLE